MLELAEIFRQAGPAYLNQHKEKILPSHRRAIVDIEACRTIKMGGHLYECDVCKRPHHAYHSCKNRHCPKCRDARISRITSLIQEKDDAVADEGQTAENKIETGVERAGKSEPLRCRHCGGWLSLVMRLFKVGSITKVPP